MPRPVRESGQLKPPLCYYGSMRKIVEIDLLGDERLQGQIAADSLWIVLLGVLFGVLGAVALPHESITPLWFVVLGIASIMALPLHEVVHAAAFFCVFRRSCAY